MANKLLKDFTMDGVTYDVPILGIKGQQETNYRIGDINLTPANILFFGNNAITAITDDTQTFWKNKGTGYTYILTAGVTNGQPSQYGMIVSHVSGNIVTQTWINAIGGKQYTRAASTSGATMPDWVATTPITGLKGQQETSYRTGNVNLTPNNLLYFGMNPITDISQDTMTFWRGKGTGYCFISSANDVTSGQPSESGWLINIVANNSSGITQYWYRYTSGMIWYRATNASATTMPAWKSLAPLDSPTFTGTPKAPTNTTYTTSNTQIATTAFVQNAIKRRLPITTSSTGKITTTVASGTEFTYALHFFEAPSAGTAIITANVSFPYNTTGARQAALVSRSSSSASWSSSISEAISINAGTWPTMFQLSCVNRCTSGEQFSFRFRQNSGSSLRVDGYATIYFMPD